MKSNRPSPIASEAAIPEIIEGLGAIFGRGVAIEVRPLGRLGVAGRTGADLLVSVVCDGNRFEFAAETKLRSTPRLIEEAAGRSRRRAAESGRLAMVIVPYLNEKRLDWLRDEGVSGLDLCGNGLVMVPGRIYLRCTGQPNRHPESRPARFAYRGATSLTPRVFLRRREYAGVGQIKDEIGAAGGWVALSTVSKALKRMVDDLIVSRTDERITLLQPDALLDALAEGFVPPKPDRIERAKTPLPLADLFRRMAPADRAAGGSAGARLVLSGASSQDRYAAGLRADAPTLYCDDLDDLRRRLGSDWKPTDRFADLTVIETRDPTVFFDARTDSEGVVVASPVQTYLELASGGDKREIEMAREVRAGILRDLGADGVVA